MPFGGNYDRYYKNIYVPAIEAAGFIPLRGDTVFRAGAVMEDVWTATQTSSVVLADVTGRNPNVFYELGLAHALGKPVVIISNNREDIPFDIQHLRYIDYDKDDESWGQTLQLRIREALEQRDGDAKGVSMFLKPIGPPARYLTDRQKAIVGCWEGCGQDIYVEKDHDKVKMHMRFEFSLNQSQILGAAEITTRNLSGHDSVQVSVNGEFYNDDLLELIYRSRIRKQYGAMVIRISDELDKLDGHFAGFSPTRSCFIMGAFELARPKA